MIIYKATNKVNGMSYVGSTTKSLNIRKTGHISKSKNSPNLYFHKALRKYGIDNFVWEVLCECDTKEEMLEMEFHYIKQYDVFGNGYNCTEGYDNTTLGYRFTYKQRQETSKRNKGSKNPNHNNKWTDEQRLIASERQKENHQHLIGDGNPAKRLDVRKKLSEGKLGNNNPNSKKWLIIKPDGGIISFEGGIKRKLKELGLTYSRIKPVLDGKIDNYKGWKIKCE